MSEIKWKEGAFAAILLICSIFAIIYLMDMKDDFDRPIITNTTFGILNKDVSRNYEILTNDGSTLIFEYGGGISSVKFKDMWDNLKIGKYYTCEKKIMTCIFPMDCKLVYPHVGNCVEV
jgi:hypothetical protein